MGGETQIVLQGKDWPVLSWSDPRQYRVSQVEDALLHRLGT